jgi:hypothetical protein
MSITNEPIAAGWPLHPGDTIIRKNLHSRFGGRKQGGIGPSSQSPNVFLFTDPLVGERHGYIDNWKADGCYHYTGEGQRGDQQMKQGNAAILHHGAQARSLRLFRGVGGTVRYEGEFKVDESHPYYTAEAPETGGGPVRTVIVFRLRPLDVTAPMGTGATVLPTSPIVEIVLPEQSQTEKFVVEPSREPYEAEKREMRLVEAFSTYLVHIGRQPARLKIIPAGEAKPIFCDIYVQSLGLLVEAKGSVERGSIRMALGQLIDYSRFVVAESKALLLPSRPRDDLLALIQSAGMGVYFPSADNFDFIAA